jgi:hypothetical protein
MNKIEKYLTEKVDTTKEVKELIKLSKDFIFDMKMLKTKYDFQSIEGMTKNFLKSYIDDLNKIYKRM